MFMKNEVLLNDAARQQLKKGIDTVCNAVKATLGPQGRNVIINRDNNPPHITKDGVTVAKEIYLNDPYEMMGANLIKNIASKTCDDSGDGPQPLYSKILTPNGFVEMGEIKVGDKICGTNGTVQEIIGVFPKGKKEIYKIKLSNNRIVECCEDHLWHIITNNGKEKITPLKNIINDFVSINKNGHNNYRYYVPTTIVDFNEESLPIDPYLLGLLIGDGSLVDNGSIELSLGFKKRHIIDKIKTPEGIYFDFTENNKKNYIRLKFHGTDINGKSLRDHLKDIGLANSRSCTKFIPKIYLYSSLKSRMGLLNGLIDTDGYINSRNLFEYSTISESLYNDMIELCRGLGIQSHGYKMDRKPDSSYSNTSIFRINELKGYKYGLKIIDIEKTERFTDMQCIKVSNEDHLYITDDYVVTHNTTTSTVLAQAIIENGYNAIKTKKVNPIALKRGIEKASKMVVDFIQKSSINVNENPEITKNVAIISANNDEFIGGLISEAINNVGVYGAVTVEKSSNIETTLSSTAGFRISQRGYLSPYFITNESKSECILEDVWIYITDKKLTKTSDVLNLLNIVAEQNKSLLIIAEDVTEDALSTLVLNKLQAGIKVCAIKGPEFGDNRKNNLADIAILTGGEVDTIMQNGEFGTASKVIVKKENTIIIGAEGHKPSIDSRVKELVELKNSLSNDFEIKLINERLSRFSNGVSVLNVGAKTEIELNEKLDRVDDALNATRAAIEEGVVPGGGTIFLRAVDQLMKNEYKFTKEEMPGLNVMIVALQQPILQILYNAGIEDSNDVIDKILDKKSIFFGYNAKKYCYGNLFKQGVIDPAKVLRVALENAVSVSNLFLTTECAISHV